MKQIITLIFLSLSLISYAKDTKYDEYGQLITDAEQQEKDKKKGILQRGGYNPDIAEEGARQRQYRNQQAPHLNNSNTKTTITAGANSNVYRCKKNGKFVYLDEQAKNKGGVTSCEKIRGDVPEGLPVEKLKDDGSIRPTYKSEEVPQEVANQASVEVAAVEENNDLENIAFDKVKNSEQKAGAEEKISQEEKANTNTAANINSKVHENSCSGAVLYHGSTFIFNDSEPCPIPEEVFKSRKPIEAEPSYYTN